MVILLSRGCILWWLKLCGVLGLLWMIFLLRSSNMNWVHSRRLRYDWLEYTDADNSPEKVCNCSAILHGEREALEQAKLLTITKEFLKRIQIPDEYYVNASQDCRNFKLSRKYVTFPLSQEEKEFPLAYSMVVHHKVQNFERLLRAIYAPQNIYCVHVDKKSKPSVVAAIMAITSCFPNVLMVSRRVSVVYAGWPRVQADLNCMANLYNSTTKWKYFINLCGQDFPLKTNLEIVRTLKALRGGNSLESEKMPNEKRWRMTYTHQIVDGILQRTGNTKGPPPFNLPIFSGNAYIVVSRGYIRNVLEDSRILALMEWFKDTYSPDEFLWATIQRIPGVSGSTRPHYKYDMSDINAVARLVKWLSLEHQNDAAYPACQGNHVRTICVYSAGDLEWMIKQHHLFANKFDADKDPIPIYCLEKYLRHKALSDGL
ncbi:beta-1,3-galactosyl-O-glycosyl-glycoprotein beta-1,6-N-acetylglucosaminyltransferase-like [Thalassophryne amazonica]|uniref:beta-1,3-galactosyl-O-glycosyl-glycoprotein beta-1,6-N-acetylglucosaminyltransferase-like n=1 Tax=Thalassophryne amazonica TaxID=390379 RepID=UPI001471B085|nr:beta-1,3-galactosyl-O-glycosyl-glycoprotein beta-1,6-N-acetylglucosaminyltransferase-like [Thalassophryne amazonica]